MRFIYICLSILVDVDITIHEKQTHTIIINDNSGKRAERKRKKGNKRMKISTTELVSSGYSVLIKRINQCFSVLIIMLKVFFFTLKRNGTIAETLGTWLNIPNDLFFFSSSSIPMPKSRWFLVLLVLFGEREKEL